MVGWLAYSTGEGRGKANRKKGSGGRVITGKL